MENAIHGEIRTAPPKGWDREIGCIVFEGCGWEMCDRRDRTRLAPAESPVRTMSLGWISRFFRTWLRSAAAC